MANRSSLYFLLATLHATLYLVIPEWTALLVPWGLFLVLFLVGLFRGGIIDRRVLYPISLLLLLAGLLFVISNIRQMKRAEAGWDALYPEVIEELREGINSRTRDHLEENLHLLSEVEESIGRLYEKGYEPDLLRRHLFDLLERHRSGSPDREDLFFLFSTPDGENLAWSGDSYIADDTAMSIDQASNQVSIRLFRGNIITAAIITIPLPGIGVLSLHDHLDLEYHLSSRYSGRGRFIDLLSRRFGTDISLFPAGYQGGLEGESGTWVFPLIVRGDHIGNWFVAPISRESYIAELKSREYRFLPILLLLPWLLSCLIFRRYLAKSFLEGEQRSNRGRILYIVLVGSYLFLMRLVLLRASFPSSWVGGDYFSSRFFATGLFEEGSLSIGEFFISGLLISLFLLHVYPIMTVWGGTLSGSGKRRPGWIAGGLVLAILFSLPSPFVLERLLRDSLSSMVIDQGFVQSPVTVFWEFGLFLLSLPLFLLVSTCLRPAVTSMKRDFLSAWKVALLGCLLFALEIAMAIYGYGDKWRLIYTAVAGCFVFIGGGLITRITVTGESVPEESRGWINFRLIIVVSLLSAAFIYPGLLRYRHLTLEETGEDLIERIEAPYDNWATILLLEAADEMMDRREEIFSEKREPRGLGFYAWVNSNLSKIGWRTVLVIFDGKGEEISKFSLADFEVDADLSSFFLGRARETDNPFIYHAFSKGKEFYTAVVPYWHEGTLRRFLTLTLPTDLEERLGGGPIRFFTEDSAEDRWSIPDPMEITVTSFEGGESGTGEGWESRRDESGRLRLYRKVVQVGGIDKVVEIDFRVQGVWESMARVNFLFILHFCLMVILWGIVTGGFRGESLRGGALAGTFNKKLQIALIFFSVIPTLVLGIGGAGEAQKRLDHETRSKASDGLESFIHLVERELSSRRTNAGSGEMEFYASGKKIFARPGAALAGSEENLQLNSRYIRELAKTIGRDILVYRDNELVASSQEDLIQAGMIPRLMDEKSYADMILGKKKIVFHRQSLGNYQYLVANLLVTPFGAESPIILSTPMLWRQEEVDREVAGLKYILLMIIIGILFLASGVGVIVSSNLTRPIALLKEAFERVGSGDFRVDLEKGIGEEFDRLFLSFEQMSRQLETSQSRLSEEKIRLDGILQSVGAGIMAFGSDGRLKIVNSRAIFLLGVNLIDQVGRDLEAIDFVDPEWQELTRGVREVMISDRGGFQREFNVTRGEEAMTIRMNANRLIGESGEHQGAVIAFEDITDTIRSQKIVAWGEMARQVAHEIKNPLTPIRLSIQHLHKTFRDGAPDFPRIIDDEVRVILREIDRLRNIASDFSRYSRLDTEDVRQVDIASVISEIRELYEKEHGEIAYSFELGEGEIRGLASEEGLKKVLVNLIENGREAIDGHGRLRVEVEGEEGSDMVKIIVTDTGRGIPKSEMGMIFDPSFSTRSGGTGLGLAICKRIVEGWGGEIKISSREGDGTRVEVRIRGQSG